MNNQMKQVLMVVLFTMLLFAFFGVSEDDYQTQKQDEAVYCDNVRNNYWPDFKNIYKTVCNKSIEQTEKRVTIQNLNAVKL